MPTGLLSPMHLLRGRFSEFAPIQSLLLPLSSLSSIIAAGALLIALASSLQGLPVGMYALLLCLHRSITGNRSRARDGFGSLPEACAAVPHLSQTSQCLHSQQELALWGLGCHPGCMAPADAPRHAEHHLIHLLLERQFECQGDLYHPSVPSQLAQQPARARTGRGSVPEARWSPFEYLLASWGGARAHTGSRLAAQDSPDSVSTRPPELEQAAQLRSALARPICIP